MERKRRAWFFAPGKGRMGRGRNRPNEIPKMTVDSANKKTCPPRPTVRSETKYREAVELYGSTGLSCREICRICGLTPSGLSGHIGKYHRHLMLARYDIACDSEQALHIKMGGLRGQRPATRAKYRKAIEACERMEHLEKILSEFAGRFGVDGSGLARQLRTVAVRTGKSSETHKILPPPSFPCKLQ